MMRVCRVNRCVKRSRPGQRRDATKLQPISIKFVAMNGIMLNGVAHA
jgi:hypothetical protein